MVKNALIIHLIMDKESFGLVNCIGIMFLEHLLRNG